MIGTGRAMQFNTKTILGLFLDQHACSKHFSRAKLKLKMTCRLLARKITPPSAKHWYTISASSLSTPQELDRTSAELLRQIYGLRVLTPLISSKHRRVRRVPDQRRSAIAEVDLSPLTLPQWQLLG